MPVRDDPSFLQTCAPQIAGLHALWEAKRAGRTLPARADFDLWELKPWLGRTSLFDVLDGALTDGADFRYRLIGSDIVADFDHDLTGEFVSRTSLAAGPEAALANLRAVVANCRPRWRGDLVPCLDGTMLSGERLFLPLSPDGKTVDMILHYMTDLRAADGSTARPARSTFWAQLE